MNYTFTHINTEVLDSESKIIEFECEGFRYYVRCLNGIVQYIKGQRAEIYMNVETPPTDEQIIAHDIRREEFNQNHNIVQNWIDGL